jgi:hypothetical protein
LNHSIISDIRSLLEIKKFIEFKGERFHPFNRQTGSFEFKVEDKNGTHRIVQWPWAIRKLTAGTEKTTMTQLDLYNVQMNIQDANTLVGESRWDALCAKHDIETGKFALEGVEIDIPTVIEQSLLEYLAQV